MADSSDVSSLMKSVREEVVMATYSTMVVAGTILMLGNMSRNLHLGNPLSIPHSILYAAFLVTYVLRRRIGARWLAPILLVALYLGGAFGYYIYGFVGNSAPLFLSLCIVAASFYGPRGGLVAAVVAGATMAVVATFAITGHLVFSYDMKSFVSSPFSWIAALTTFGAMAALMLTQVGLMHGKMVSLLREQQARIKEMAQANARLEQEIVARTEVEVALRRQSAMLESILDSIPGGVTVFNSELRQVTCNRTFKQLLGYPDELFIDPQPALEDFLRYNAAHGEYGSDNPERVVKEILRLARQPVPHVIERERPNGTVLEVRGAPLPEGGFLTVYTDITARKRSEREIMRLNERFTLALKTVGLGIFDWDASKKTLLADARVFEIFGVSPKGRNGQFNDWVDYLHPEDRDRTIQQIVTSLRNKKVSDVKLAYRIVRPDGGIRHLEVHNHIIRDETGWAQRLIGADFDATERKQTEERLILAEKVFDNSPVAIMITNRENRIISVNDAFVRITGYPEAEILGSDPKFLRSGLHDADFFKRMWQSLDETDFWEGEVWDRRKNGESYPMWTTINVVHDREDPSRVHYVAIFSDITERKQAEEHINHLAHHDPLTTLPNRMALEARLEQSIADADRNQRSVAVMFLDLDRFKTINDSLGHHVGDLLLIEVARRLRQTVRSSDTVARLGGDEFIVVLPALEAPEVAATVAGSILEALRQPYLIEGYVLHSTPSIGVAIYPQDGSDVTTVMKYADTAMYHAKDIGRNGFQFFSMEMNRVAMERLDVERQLREALTTDQFVLHYQPRFDRDGQITGVEALIRWKRPGHGLLLPSQFIPVAEENDLILLVGDWVLDAVAGQVRTWLEADLPVPPVGINLSVRQLRQSTLPGRIAEVMNAAGLPPYLLEFEVTESMAMDDPEKASRLLRELRVMGVSLAIDDFGTGHSSLSYLKSLPVDYLKIDRSFVAGITHDSGDLAIVRGTIALAQSFGLTVVAEGVETAEQLALLMSAECDEFQGFYFSRPLPVDEFEAFLKSHSNDPTSDSTSS
jgi:diguanylate cyclase (GGDEF)-like protein/PAS domain S-box-containing protein